MNPFQNCKPYSLSTMYRGYEIEITQINVNVKLDGKIIDNSFAHSRVEAEYLIDKLIEKRRRNAA
jgi:hypothetical protein